MSGIVAHRGLLLAAAANFRAMVVASSPLVYYPMDETSGTTMDALAGADGTYLGAPALGNAGILPNDPGGSMGTVALANRARATRALTGNPDFTCCLAIRTSHTSTQMLVFDQDTSSGGVGRHFLAINRSGSNAGDVTAGAVCVFGHSPSGQANRNAFAVGADVSDGLPHLLVWGREFGTVFLDVDGVAQTLTGVTTMSQSIFGGTYWGIGQTPIAGSDSLRYYGDVSHFACWDRALSPTERTELAAAAGF